MEHSPRVITTVILVVVTCVTTVAVLSPVAGIPDITFDVVVLSLVLAVLIICADFFEIDAPLTSVRITVSVSTALCFAAVITLGPVLGALIAGGSALTIEVLQRRDLIKTAVNTTNYLFAAFVSGMIYHTLADPAFSPIGSLENLAVTILAASTYTIVDSAIIALVLSQVVGHSPFDMWRANLRGALFEHVSLPTIGIMVPVLYQESLFALLIVVIPLLGPYLAFRSYRQIHEETRETLSVLADMLDRRDPYTAEHSQRVSDMVRKMLSRYPEVSFEDYEAIITAARIHDLGKVTTSDATLLKPGRLEPEEFEEMKRHSPDGAEILGHISVFQTAATVIRHHHERWDGKGYPDGISGEQIPIGSRLIAVADTYDAMTTDRPYRKALSHAVAVSEIRRNAGTQFEPRAVDAFMEMINESPDLARQPLLHEVTPSD